MIECSVVRDFFVLNSDTKTDNGLVNYVDLEKAFGEDEAYRFLERGIMDELVFKKKVVRLLKEKQDELKKYRVSLTEAFIRGFIIGAGAMAGVQISSLWYDEIIKALEE